MIDEPIRQRLVRAEPAVATGVALDGSRPPAQCPRRSARGRCRGYAAGRRPESRCPARCHRCRPSPGGEGPLMRPAPTACRGVPELSRNSPALAAMPMVTVATSHGIDRMQSRMASMPGTEPPGEFVDEQPDVGLGVLRGQQQETCTQPVAVPLLQRFAEQQRAALEQALVDRLVQFVTWDPGVVAHGLSVAVPRSLRPVTLLSAALPTAACSRRAATPPSGRGRGPARCSPPRVGSQGPIGLRSASWVDARLGHHPAGAFEQLPPHEPESHVHATETASAARWSTPARPRSRSRTEQHDDHYDVDHHEGQVTRPKSTTPPTIASR